MLIPNKLIAGMNCSGTALYFSTEIWTPVPSSSEKAKIVTEMFLAVLTYVSYARPSRSCLVPFKAKAPSVSFNNVGLYLSSKSPNVWPSANVSLNV